MGAHQNITDQNLTNTNTALNNTNADLNITKVKLNDVDARLTLTEQNLNLLKDRVNHIAERAIQNNEIPNPVKPSLEEESLLRNILGNDYYQILDHNYMIVTRDEIVKAAKKVINKAILACNITTTAYDERNMYRERQENRNKMIRNGEKLGEEGDEVEKELNNLDESRASRKLKIAKDVREKKVDKSVLNSYDQQTEEMRDELEERRKKIKSDADLNEKDVEKLESEFVSTIKRIGKNGSYVGEIIEVVGAVINIADSVKKYVEQKQAETRREERFKKRAEGLKKELIAMTNDGGKETFEKANAVYLARYYATYGRDDISYHPRNTNGDDSVYYVFSGIDRKFSLIPNFQEFFVWQGLLGERIENFKEKLKAVYSQGEIPKLYKDYLPYIKEKDYLNFIHNDKKNEFKVKYQLYRALSQLAEFDEMKTYGRKECGDRNEVKRGLLFSLIPILWGVGILHSIERAQNEILWSQNIPNLKEVMKMYLVIADKLEQILKTKCVYARLKYYNDWTKSEYGKNLLEKNEKILNVEFINKEAKEKFKQAFDLYQKISNTGIVDRENYVSYFFEYKNVGAQIMNQI